MSDWSQSRQQCATATRLGVLGHQRSDRPCVCGTFLTYAASPPIRDHDCVPLTTGAVVAVSIFGGLAPDFFATFDVAFFTLLLVTAGEPWPDALPRLNSDGTANWTVMVFCGCYIIISTWLVLQVPGGFAGQPGQMDWLDRLLA